MRISDWSSDVCSSDLHGLACVEAGAAILDIGGESTRPGAAEVSAGEEQDRILPVIEELARQTDALLSVDPYRAGPPRLAIATGRSAERRLGKECCRSCYSRWSPLP